MEPSTMSLYHFFPRKMWIIQISLFDIIFHPLTDCFSMNKLKICYFLTYILYVLSVRFQLENWSAPARLGSNSSLVFRCLSIATLLKSHFVRSARVTYRQENYKTTNWMTLFCNWFNWKVNCDAIVFSICANKELKV